MSNRDDFSDARARQAVRPAVVSPVHYSSTAPAPSSHRSEPPGVQIWGGRLRILEEVGRGAMGQIVRVSDKKLGREMALKVAQLPRDQMPRDLLARFVEEAQITAQLEHPNVVPVHDLGVSPEGHAYFSMKLVKGQSLELILEKRRARDPEILAQFGLRRLLDVFLQVCQALEYAHARGVIHRDLKPANIMVGDFGEVLVMDWGLAKLVSDRPSGDRGVSVAPEQVTAIENQEPARRDSVLPSPPLTPGVTSVRAGKKAWETQTGLLMGTPAYMSPEQAKGGAVDARTDYYALGVILYEILCGEVPFDDDDPQVIVKRLLTEEPRPPSEIDANVPRALEMLALRLLEKDQEKRTLTITQIRAHVQNYIEGISGEYRGESLLGNVLWVAGAVSLFAFLVWYLTGQSAAEVLTLGPPAVLNAVGWFLLVLALGYPLWAAARSLQDIREEHDYFRPPNDGQLFISGYLAHRTFAAALAPLFQLVFIVELVTVTVAQVARGAAGSGELIQRISTQMRREWSEALIVFLVFQFAYLFLLSTEVRFARRVERYDFLIRRPRWETVWPFFLVIVLLSTVVTTDVLEWIASRGGDWLAFLREEVLTPRLSLIEIVKNLVFQGTFLLGLAVCTMLLAFPVPELLAALRITYQPADEAAVISRAQFFCRAVATFRVARAIWLYGGAMIGSLTAITVLGTGSERPLVEKVLYLIGPASIGLVGYATVSRYIRSFLEHAPPVERMLERRRGEAAREQWLATVSQLEKAPWRWRLIQLAVPVVCLLGYLIWTGTGIHREAIRELIVPVTTKDWLIILPYALLVPVLLTRDQVQTRLLKRRLTKLDEAPASAS